MSKRLFMKKDILQLKLHFTKDDLDLVSWLQTSSTQLIENLVQILKKQITNSVITDCFLQDEIPEHAELILSVSSRRYLSILLVHELKRYASHSFHFFAEKPGYHKILEKVLQKQAQKQGHKISSLPSSVKEQEKFLTVLMSAEDKPSHATKDKILQKTAAVILKSAIKKLAPKMIKRITPTLGWVLLAKDIYDFGGDAVRVTVPFVVQIAHHRTLGVAKMPI